MYGSDYAWILQGNFNDLSWKWWIDQIECPQKGLWHAVQGLIFVSSYYGVEETESFFSEFVSRLHGFTGLTTPSKIMFSRLSVVCWFDVVALFVGLSK